MRRLLLVPLACLMLFVGVGSPAVARPITGEFKGPACADTVSGDAFFTGTSVEVFLVTAEPSCKSVHYTVFVFDEEGDVTPLATGSQRGNGTTDLLFSIPVTDDDDTVCVYVTTSRGKKAFDRGPDAGCIPLTVDGGIPGLDFR